MHAVRVWDLPVRLFHWLLTAGIAVAFVTAKIGGAMMVWHGRAGLFVLGLLVFRVVWGCIGSPHARFASFVRGPAAIRAYLQGRWRGTGHNPLGALSVIGLLAFVGAQVGTGLFSNDDIAFQGPLAGALDEAWSARLGAIHLQLQYVLIGLVLLHVAAIVYYLAVKRDNLVKPMLTGWKTIEAATPPPAPPRHRPLALVIAAAVALAAVLAAGGGWRAAPAPVAAPVAVPAW
ncbi:MAG: cytochrome b/b6 domain-containing protein [Pseudomonadota bacterium]